MDRLAALKATLVATCFVAFIVCLFVWTDTTALVMLGCVVLFLVLTLWGMAYDSFKRNHMNKGGQS